MINTTVEEFWDLDSAHPDVPLQVLGLKRGSSEDPRRLLREVGSLAVNVGSAGGLYAWHAAQAYCVNSLRYFRK